MPILVVCNLVYTTKVSIAHDLSPFDERLYLVGSELLNPAVYKIAIGNFRYGEFTQYLFKYHKGRNLGISINALQCILGN